MNPAQFYPTLIKEGEVFYFSSPKISSEEPHFFICIRKGADEVLLFSCTTTQKDKREDYHNRKGVSLKTLVAIDKNKSGVDFTAAHSYVDCNSLVPYTMMEFSVLCGTGKIAYKGTLDSDYYYQILVGLHSSDEISPEIKETLPSPDDIDA